MNIKIAKFNRCQLVTKFIQLQEAASILEIIGVERKEVRHSKFLKWMFSERTLNVATPDSPVMHLLDKYIERMGDANPYRITDKIINAIQTRSVIARNISAETGHATRGVTYNAMGGSIDLLLRGEFANAKGETVAPFSIVIENKVDTVEHDDQTMKYFCYMTGTMVDGANFSAYKSPLHQDDEYVFFVYLSPSTEDEMNSPLDIACSDHFVHISYQDVLDGVIMPLLQRDNLSTITHGNLNQYVTSLGKVTQSKSPQATRVMAIPYDTQESAVQVWDKHSQLITEALQAKRKKVWAETYDKILAEFWENHNTLFSTLLCIVSGYHPDVAVRKYATSLYYSSLESKAKCTVDGDITHPMDIAKVACEFAKRYVEYYENNANFTSPASDLSNQLVNDSINICGKALPANLFDPKTENTYKMSYNGQTVKFNKNCWQTGTSGNQFATLLSFIEKQTFFDMKVDKI